MYVSLLIKLMLRNCIITIETNMTVPCEEPLTTKQM